MMAVTGSGSCCIEETIKPYGGKAEGQHHLALSVAKGRLTSL